ncbi:MAG: UDP-N-acetylglucosamine--LPS N-acetylglucosamine transferase [Acaryochloridaceae cyanobacterium CSU_3_4]|nr:UDP-N-acetylglucosamine--LPS N-acetylglucosamine transferase [Acaryochloridaceae cyanobacterium CSU_3_4]
MKLLLAATSGGHFATMQSLKPFWSLHDRLWITDPKSDTENLCTDGERVIWLPYQGPRDVGALLGNLPQVINILRKEQPDLIISTGSSIAVGFALVAKFLNIRFMYIESISRSNDLSLSGKLVYLLCDELYVQWPKLSQKYPKAVFAGYVT